METKDPKKITLSHEIDCWNQPAADRYKPTRPGCEKGHRKYLASSKDSKQRFDTRPQRAQTCAQAILDVVEQHHGKDLDEIRLTEVYVGYAVNGEDRGDTHQNKTSSCYLMSLIKAICALRFHVGGTPIYTSHFFIVCLIMEEENAEVGEKIVSAISNSMHTDGYGFNIADCGNSSSSMKSADREKLGRNIDWIVKHSPYLANCVAQTKLINDRLALEAEVRKL